MTQIVTLTLFRFHGPLARIGAFALMGLARPAFWNVKTCSFWKLVGSGSREGFTPIPDTGTYGIFAVWPDHDAAQQGVVTSLPWRLFRRLSSEEFNLFLSPMQSRGSWSGKTPFSLGSKAQTAGPLAALTRASIRASKLLRFWSAEPGVSDRIGANQDVLFKIGLGEVPWLHQITFSIWPDQAAMAQFARTGAHAEAIRDVRDGDWFAEELYARFRVIGQTGSWTNPRHMKGPLL